MMINAFLAYYIWMKIGYIYKFFVVIILLEIDHGFKFRPKINKKKELLLLNGKAEHC
jgi:hypothetical protein